MDHLVRRAAFVNDDAHIGNTSTYDYTPYQCPSDRFESSITEDRVPCALPASDAGRLVPVRRAAACPCLRNVVGKSSKARGEVRGSDSPGRALSQRAFRAAIASAWRRLVDGVLIITLRECRERRKYALHELVAACIAPEMSGSLFWFVCDRPRADPNKFATSTDRGKYGCFRSHTAAWKVAARMGWKRALILEDDFMVRDSLCPSLLHSAADVLDVDGSVSAIALGWFMIFGQGGKHSRTYNVERVSVGNGATAYVINVPAIGRTIAPFARKIDDPQEPRDLYICPADHYLMNGKVPNVYHIATSIATQRPDASEISYPKFDLFWVDVANKLKLFWITGRVSRLSWRIVMYFSIIVLVAVVTCVAVCGSALSGRRSQVGAVKATQRSAARVGK